MAARLVSWALATSGPTISLTKGNAGRATMQAWAVGDEFAVFHEGNYFPAIPKLGANKFVGHGGKSTKNTVLHRTCEAIQYIVPNNLNKDVCDLWHSLRHRIQTFNAFGTTGGIRPQNRPRNSNTFRYPSLIEHVGEWTLSHGVIHLPFVLSSVGPGRSNEIKRYGVFREDVADLAAVSVSKLKVYVPVLTMSLGYVPCDFCRFSPPLRAVTWPG